MSTGHPTARTARSIFTVSASTPRPGPSAMAEAFSTTFGGAPFSGQSETIASCGACAATMELDSGCVTTESKPVPMASAAWAQRAGRAGKAGTASDDGEPAEIAFVRKGAAARQQAGQFVRDEDLPRRRWGRSAIAPRHNFEASDPGRERFADEHVLANPTAMVTSATTATSLSCGGQFFSSSKAARPLGRSSATVRKKRAARAAFSFATTCARIPRNAPRAWTPSSASMTTPSLRGNSRSSRQSKICSEGNSSRSFFQLEDL